jgi:hypothetical protein
MDDLASLLGMDAVERCSVDTLAFRSVHMVVCHHENQVGCSCAEGWQIWAGEERGALKEERQQLEQMQELAQELGLEHLRRRQPMFSIDAFA